MRILYYSSHPQLNLSLQTGPGTHMREMIQAFKNSGHEVLPVIIGDILKSESQLGPAQATNYRMKTILKVLLPSAFWRSLKELKLLRRDTQAESLLEIQLMTFKPDLIYERAAYMQRSGLRVARKYGIRHFMEINAPFLPETNYFEKSGTWLRKKAIAIEKEQISEPEKVFVVSSVLKSYYSPYTSNPDKIIVTPNCIDPDKIDIDYILKQELNNRLNLDGQFIVGFVGSIFSYHGVDILIRAMPPLLKKYPNSILLIVGDGHLIPELKQLAGSLQIGSKVIFTGSIPHNQVFTYIDLMDITVMPKSNSYGSPVKIFEYGIMGKAVIAADTIPIRDVMESMKDGILIEPNAQVLSDAIVQLIENKELRISLATHFKEKIIQNYTWMKTVEKIM
jgi:glycosyltransferase involved in cell wall biosynthesis